MEIDFEPRRRADGSIDHDHYRRRAAALRNEARRDTVASACRWIAAAATRLKERVAAVPRPPARSSHQGRPRHVRRTHGTQTPA